MELPGRRRRRTQGRLVDVAKGDKQRGAVTEEDSGTGGHAEP